MGCTIHSGDREFGVPDEYPLEAAGCRIDEINNIVRGMYGYLSMEAVTTLCL